MEALCLRLLKISQMFSEDNCCPWLRTRVSDSDLALVMNLLDVLWRIAIALSCVLHR